MTHKCPKCGKRWKCFTDELFNVLLDKELCDLPDDSECYNCSGSLSLKTEIDRIIVNLKKARQEGKIIGL